MTVVALQAWCDYVTENEYRDELAGSSLPAHAVDHALETFRRAVSFRVQEFAVLADGRRLALVAERRFSVVVHATGRSEPVDPWPFLTLERLAADVRTTVLADDGDSTQEHPWEWLAARVRDHGVDASPDGFWS